MSSVRPDRPEAGKPYWRSLEELADDPEFQRFVRDEFPSTADEMLAPASRRNFLKFMGASIALAGTAACRWPVEEILPFAHRPEGHVPGVPLQYATAMELDGAATGLLVTSYDGRPIKVEGNPEHPFSLGSTSAVQQAAILELYDPDRSREVVCFEDGKRVASDWDAFDRFAVSHFARLEQSGGRGLHVLSGSVGSPSVRAMRERLVRRFPRMRWHEYEPHSRDSQREGLRLCCGRPYRTHLALDRAEVIVSLDEDFLLHHPAAVRYARDFASGRTAEGGRMNRLHVVESGFSLTGSMADHRVAIASRMIPALVVCLASELFLELGLALPPRAAGLRGLLEFAEGHPLRESHDWTMARELVEHRGRSLVVAGAGQPAEIHALVHVINEALGNVGRTVLYTADPDPERPSHVEAIGALASAIERGEVDTLVVLDGNPAFDAPADLDFEGKLAAVPTAVRLGLYEDETSRGCHWHLPRAHFLESWGDARAWDGTRSVAQPLIEPLLGGRSTIEVLGLIAGQGPAPGYEAVRRTFAAEVRTGDAEAAWRRALHDGVVRDTAWAVERPSLREADWGRGLSAFLHRREDLPAGQVELVFAPAPAIHDGRFANNGWLQELPDPLTKLTWDNALIVSPATAGALGVRQGDVLRVRAGERSLDLPVYLLPGQAPGSLAVWTGYGRRHGGRVAAGVGFDVYPLRSSRSMTWRLVEVEKTRRRYPLSTTQNHWAIDTRGKQETESRARIHAREIELVTYREHPEAAKHIGPEHHPVNLWREKEYDGYKWGMSIDLSVCTGCNACVVACQAENNIPVVGKDEVANGREMHWIRVDRYFSGSPDEPSVSMQPMTCQHCENAPCEQVCPVAATVHDDEGLNVMVYNRCIGTRYCLNNCPYKVRRFNWFNNHKHETDLQKMIYNPEVTVRSRGVMEKCTFCLQRISAAKIRAKNEGRRVGDGEITPACAQACPTQAISFGDLNDPDSRIKRMHEHPRSYAVLDEMNTRPRTLYLARLRNRGEDGATAGGHEGES